MQASFYFLRNFSEEYLKICVLKLNKRGEEFWVPEDFIDRETVFLEISEEEKKESEKREERAPAVAPLSKINLSFTENQADSLLNGAKTIDLSNVATPVKSVGQNPPQEIHVLELEPLANFTLTPINTPAKTAASNAPVFSPTLVAQDESSLGFGKLESPILHNKTPNLFSTPDHFISPGMFSNNFSNPKNSNDSIFASPEVNKKSSDGFFNFGSNSN